jgi:hypothetical protein
MRRTLLRVSVLGLLLAMSCGGGSCGGGGCGGCGDGTYQFPEDDPNRPDALVQDDILRVRINQTFLDFIKPQLPSLIASQLGASGGGMYVDAQNILHIPLPDIDAFDIGVADAKLRQAEALLFLNDLDSNLDVRFEEPNNVRLTIDGIRLGLSARIKENVIGSTSSCPIFGDIGPRNAGEPKHAAELSIEANIDPGVGPRPDYPLDIRVNLDSVSIDDLDLDVAGSSVYCQEPECRDCALEVGGTCLDPGGRCVECDIFCGGVTNAVVNLAVALVDLIRPILNRVLTPVVEGLLGNTLNNLNGSSAKVETQLDLATLAGIDALKNALPIGVLVAPTPGRFPVGDRGNGLGMEITMNGGTEAEIADCIGQLDDFIPSPGPVPTPPATDKKGRPYHLFTTFSSSFLNQGLYSTHRSGTLCLRLGSEDVRDLTGGAFTLNASLLSILASDITELATDTAPVIIELKPRNPGFIDLGTGEVTGQDSMGNDLYDWLLKLTLEDIGIAFHVFMHDRYVRVFEVTSDVFVGLNIVVQPDNTLQVALGELRIDDFNETFNEILPNANFADVLPTLLDLALGAVLNQSLTFDLDITNAVSDALGGAPLFLRVNDIYRDGTQEDYLTMTLTFTSSATGNLLLTADTQARLHEDGGGLLAQLDERRVPTGQLHLRVGDDLPYVDQMALEYQVRVDSGLWRTPRPAQPDGSLWIEDAKLKLPGRHQVEVRARYQGDYQSLDATPEVFSLLVDPVAPTISARLGDAGVEVRVHDALTEDASQLGLQARVDGGAWTPVLLTAVGPGEATAQLPYRDLTGAERVELMATDAAENTSRVAKVRLGLTAAPAAPEGASAEGGGCACHDVGVPHGHAEWPIVLFAALFGALLYRVRRRD